MENLFSSGAPHIHILPQFRNNSACCLVGVVSALPRPKYFLMTIFPMCVCATVNCVILQTKREKCALNKEFLDLLNEKSVSGVYSGRVGLQIQQKYIASV